VAGPRIRLSSSQHFPSRLPLAHPNRRSRIPGGRHRPIRIVEVGFPAGATVAFETGRRDADVAQQIWVLAGNIEVTVGAVTHKLEPDDCLAMKLDAPVTFRNRTRKEARYVVVLAS
jgi:hypothetical protein